MIITRKHWYPADVCSHCKGVASEENIYIYYIDRCELWGFLREINSGISHVRYQFLSRRNYLRPLLCYSEYDCKLKKFREMLLTTLAHNQHDVIGVI